MSHAHIAAGLLYAQDVVSKKIPASKWTRLACHRQITDLKKKYHAGKWPYWFDPARGEKVCGFIENLRHIKGEWTGQKIKLEPWQCFYLTTLFGWVHKDTGFRRFRTSYLEVPRKNAKSTISSGVMLYMASGDREGGAECYSAATSKDQARIVFDAACKMANKSPDFKKYFDVRVQAHNILVKETDSTCKAVSAEAGNLDGLNVHFASIDELHAHKSRAVYDVIETGAGARAQSLISVITTAGTDITGICHELHEYLQKILDGVWADDSFFGIIYTIDDTDDWTTEAALRKANPNYGVSVKTEYLLNLVNKAKRSPASQSNFKTKHLDVWERSNTSWMDMAKWRACGGAALKIESFFGKKCWLGLDLSSKLDVTALVLLFNEENKWQIFGRYYLPEDTVEEKQHTTLSHYKAWAEHGRFTLTPGNIIDLDYIEQDIIKICGQFDVQDVAYDPWQATQLAVHLQQQRVPMVEVRAIVSNFSEPMKQLEALVHSKILQHGDDPVMAWMVSNVVAHYDKKDNIYPNKEKPDNKIDGVIALIMALSRAILGAQNTASVYDTRGIVTL
jgi:phage terminase large subunit-like protein